MPLWEGKGGIGGILPWGFWYLDPFHSLRCMCLALENLSSWSQLCHGRQARVGHPALPPASSGLTTTPSQGNEPLPLFLRKCCSSAAEFLLQLWCLGEVSAGVAVVCKFWAGEEELLTHFLGQFSLYPLCFVAKHQGESRALL